MFDLSRNLGILDASEQARLTGAAVTVLGLGGLGGVIAEVLARTGIGRLRLIDHDRFDASNLNRQIFAFQDTIGRAKTEVTAEFLKRINPAIDTQQADTITEANADELLRGQDVVVLAADDLMPCLIAARVARGLAIPVVEGWALPYCNVRVFTPTTPSFEECYGFTDLPTPLGAITAARRAELSAQMILTMRQLDGVTAHYGPDIEARVVARQIPSFAPMVWFAATRMALEVTKLLLGRGQPSLAPAFAVYDPFLDRIPDQNGG